MTLPQITTKQQTIIILLYRFRFSNRNQIQALLKHNYHSRIINWLNDLTKKEYIYRIYSTKRSEINNLAIYYLDHNGIGFLRGQAYPADNLDKLYREKNRSANFMAKQLLLADICLDLQTKSDDRIKYAAATASDLANPDYRYHFLADLNPDLIFSKKIQGSKKGLTKYYLLEMFEPTLPFYSVRKKIRNYIDFYYSNQWEIQTSKKFPILLLVCPTLAAMIKLKIYVKKLLTEDYENIELIIRFTYMEKVEASGIDGEIWESI